MSQKYNIANERPAISKSEIDGYKNFNLLLKEQSEIMTSQTKGKWTRGILIALVSAGLLYFLFPFSEEVKENINPDKKENMVVLIENEKKKINNVPADNTEELEKEGVVAMENIVTKETEQSKEKIKEEESLKEVVNYNYVEASPVKGLQQLYKYFGTALSYPTAVLKDSIEGTVLVGFVVGKDGEIKNIEVLKSLGVSMDNEAIRVIKNMPRWKAATVNQEPVESKLSIPLSFNIKNN